ncbi:MAG TPA: FHA domain-containing protein [Anaerolineales bacterium]|nr:FHA domain-containing protein [Anaerolineales bacterium]
MHENGEDVPVLIAQSGRLRGTRWPLNGERFLIGRGADCNLTIADRQVSRHHAVLHRRSDGYWIEDLGSKNGTHVNGSPLARPALLQDGDVIHVALAVQLTFVGSEATVPLSISDAAEMGLGRLRMDPQAHRVWIGSTELEPPLSPPQYRMLSLLFQNTDRVVSREEVVATVWPDTEVSGVSDQAIDALVRRLRGRLAELDPTAEYVTTVRGHGFRLQNPI